MQSTGNLLFLSAILLLASNKYLLADLVKLSSHDTIPSDSLECDSTIRTVIEQNKGLNGEYDYCIDDDQEEKDNDDNGNFDRAVGYYNTRSRSTYKDELDEIPKHYSKNITEILIRNDYLEEMGWPIFYTNTKLNVNEIYKTKEKARALVLLRLERELEFNKGQAPLCWPFERHGIDWSKCFLVHLVVSF